MKRDDTLIVVLAGIIALVLVGGGGMMGFGGYGMMGGNGFWLGGLMGLFSMALTIIVLVLLAMWLVNHLKQ